MTLDADCNTTAPLTPVPNGFTVDGAGHTISFSDPSGGHFSGAVLTNAGASMFIQNLTIAGPAGGLAVPTDCSLLLFGILFGPAAAGAPGVDASGTVNNVNVENVFQQPTTAFGSCQVGHAIRANAFTTPQTVTITNTNVTGYQKGGLTASGSEMTMNVSNSTVGPPASLEGFIAQNGVQYGGSSGGTSGMISNSVIFGSGDQVSGPGAPGGGTDGTAVLLFTAKDVTVTHNTLMGTNTDQGVSVTADSTGIVVSFNHDTRTVSTGYPDPTGIGILVDPSGATLICNTFSGWNKNIVGAIQVGCTPLPNGTCQVAYTTNMPTVDGGMPPFVWSESGPLPPGLSLSSTGAITGTPTSTGTFAFTATVVDSTSPPFTATQDESITIGGTCGAPGILLVKSANVSSFSASGTVITYSFKVSNTGTEPLSNVVVTDPLAGLSSIACPASSLAVGASMTCTATYTTTSADVTRGNVSNTATVTGNDPSGATAGPSTSTVTIPAASAPTAPAASAPTAPAASAPSAVPAASVSPITPTQVQVTG